MKPIFSLFFTALAVSGLATAAGANLVTNGSFEQGLGGIGSFTGWQTVLGDSATFVDSSGQTGTHYGQASDGLWAAYLGSTAASGGATISQTLTTVANLKYLLTFDLANDNTGQAASNTFRVSAGGVQLFSATNLPAENYQHEVFQFVASGASTVLSFSASNDIGYVELDNVAATAAPEPSGAILLLMAPVAVVLRARLAGRKFVLACV